MNHNGQQENIWSMSLGQEADYQRIIGALDAPKPRTGLLDPSFVYTSGADVQAVWRRHGWKPAHEAKND